MTTCAPKCTWSTSQVDPLRAVFPRPSQAHVMFVVHCCVEKYTLKLLTHCP